MWRQGSCVAFSFLFMAGIYIHIPFCRKKCAYCDFASVPGKEREVKSYLKALHIEIQLKSGVLKSPDTLYIGGGTPSFLKATQIAEILENIEKIIQPLNKFSEITFEANPESLSMDKIKILKEKSVNRISLGLQSIHRKSLKKLGRLSSPIKFHEAFLVLRKSGFKNINADIMCGIPGENLKDFSETLRFLLNLRPEHISLYSLEIHRGTPFSRMKMQINDDLAAEMYAFARKTLMENGYSQYEISNFSLPGFQSLHNLNYWNNGEYLGFGPSAVSYISQKRQNNVKNLKKYITYLIEKRQCPTVRTEKLKGREKLAEKIMLGLRKTDGIELGNDIFIKFREIVDIIL